MQQETRAEEIANALTGRTCEAFEVMRPNEVADAQLYAEVTAIVERCALCQTWELLENLGAAKDCPDCQTIPPLLRKHGSR